MTAEPVFSPLESKQSRRLIWLGWGLICIHGLLVAYLATRYTPTQDEVAHLPAGLANWKLGRTDVYCVNPPLVRSVAVFPLLFVEHQEDWTPLSQPMVRPEWALGTIYVKANGRTSWWHMTLARWACLPFTLLGAILCWKWGTVLWGNVPGLLTLSLWCFSPNILGYAALITPDVPSISVFLLSTWVFRQWLMQPDLMNAGKAGAALGLTLLVKSQWLILIPIWLLWGAFSCWQFGQLRKGLGELLFLNLVAWNVLCLGFGLRGIGQPLGELGYYSRAMSGETRWQHNASPGELRWKFLQHVPSPVPPDFIRGIDLQAVDFEHGRPCYLLGSWTERGRLPFYFIGLLVKTPLALTAMLLLSATLWIGMLRKRMWASASTRSDFLLLVVPSTLVFGIATWQTGLHVYVRYVFVLLPVFYLAVGSAWVLCSSAWIRYLLLLLVGLFAIESLSAYPQSLSFFNVAAGGPRGGIQFLNDANVDWGQDLRLVDEWIRLHPAAKPVHLNWPGFYNAKDVGLPAGFPKSRSPRPGWYIFSRHTLQQQDDGYAEFRVLKPVAGLGATHVVYHIPEAL